MRDFLSHFYLSHSSSLEFRSVAGPLCIFQNGEVERIWEVKCWISFGDADFWVVPEYSGEDVEHTIGNAGWGLRRWDVCVIWK